VKSEDNKLFSVFLLQISENIKRSGQVCHFLIESQNRS
jgi:hypothetical protein